MKLYLARHGESEGNVRDILYGWMDLPLTDKGREDAARLGEKLAEISLSHCCSSTLVRASETAQIALSGRDVPITLCEGLREQFMGDFEGRSFTEMMEKEREMAEQMLCDWANVEIPGGENFCDVKRRVDPHLGEIIDRGEDTLIVAHFGSLSAILSHILNLSDEACGSIVFKHGCLSCIEIEKNRKRLLFHNR